MTYVGLSEGWWDQANYNSDTEHDKEWALHFRKFAYMPSKTSNEFLADGWTKQ